MKTIKITASELIELIENHKGSTIVGLVADTDARLLKTGNPFGEVRKQTRKAAFTGLPYENLVNKEARKAFQSAPLPWGQWHIQHKIVTHKGAFYLATQSTKGIRKHNPSSVKYSTKDGLPLSIDQIKAFMPEKKESKKQLEHGVKKDSLVHFTLYAFASIKKIRVSGKSYSIA